MSEPSNNSSNFVPPSGDESVPIAAVARGNPVYRPGDDVLKSMFRGLVMLCMVGSMSAQVQPNYVPFIRRLLEDESIILSVDKPIYFPGDTVCLAIRLEDGAAV
jgi:hypothetical protein